MGSREMPNEMTKDRTTGLVGSVWWYRKFLLDFVRFEGKKEGDRDYTEKCKTIRDDRVLFGRAVCRRGV